MGYGAGLTSGQAMSSPRLRRLLRLADGESAVCCINIGTVTKRKSPLRARPTPAEILTVMLEPAAGGLG
jgi:hypothetical protein